MSANNRSPVRSYLKWSPLLTASLVVIATLVVLGFWSFYENVKQREKRMQAELDYFKTMKDQIEKKSYLCMDNIEQMQKQSTEYKSIVVDKQRDLTIALEENDELQTSLVACRKDVLKFVDESLVYYLNCS